ncbi:MAG: ABC transporter ATP-binding protein [Protaetiibacter sp.]
MTVSINIDNLTKRFSAETVVAGLDLQIADGEILVLLGPSGCGKTTTLRMLAGLEKPDEGTISFGEDVVFHGSGRVDKPTHKRNIGMVFQSYALWPHMTVRKNIAYPLKVRGMTDALRQGWVERAAELVHCTELLDRYPAQLSGGQQQRIALARGLVARPAVMLLDEPLSNLDAKLRVEVRTEIRELHQELRFTGVLVTHDQDEALALGDRIAVMRAGRIEQVDTPEAVFRSPATDYVASFIGMSNRIAWERDGADWVAASGARIARAKLGLESDAAVSRIRPDDVRLAAAGSATGTDAITFEASLITAEYGGRHIDVTVRTNDDARLHARVTGDDGAWVRSLAPGAPIAVSVPLDSLRSYAA